MKHLDKFISQTGRQTADWTEQDLQKYLEYLKTHVTEIVVSKRHDN
jgi:hypothetical protein